MNHKQVEKEINTLGYYQLFGGIVGMIIVAVSISIFIEGGQILTMIALTLPFFLSVYAGMQCLNKKQNRLFISKINQALQVISINLVGFGFTYHAGIYFILGFDIIESFLFDFELGISTAAFNYKTFEEVSFIKINLVALFILYKIYTYEKFYDQEKEEIGKNEGHLDEHLL